MRRGQKVKVIATSGGLLGREGEIRRVALKWIRRLQSTVNYDLTGKMFVFEEVGREEEVQDGRLRDSDLLAQVSGYRDGKGKSLAQDSVRVRRGDYSLVLIELLTLHWPRFSTSFLEDNIVHELLHVVRPQIGRIIKNGELVEDGDYMHKTTSMLIKNFNRLSKLDMQVLLKESVTDREVRQYLRRVSEAGKKGDEESKE
jgi:hypothetical protein